MNYIKKLLNGEKVEWKQLSELGHFYGGLTGKNKNDFSEGNAKYITYVNVFKNPAVNFEISDFVKIGENENQKKIQYGDVLFTGSSENLEEYGMSSVVNQKIEEDIYLNSFCFGFRLNEPEIFLPDFLKHIFRSFELRKQIVKTASGVTRFNVSKKKMEKVKIPIPPLAVQQKIAEILDNFCELEKELLLRKKQYEYYRNNLLSFNEIGGGDRLIFNNLRWVRLGEVCRVLRGRRLTRRDLVENGNYPVYHRGIEPIGYYNSNNRIANSVMIINVGASAGTVGFSDRAFWSSDGCFCFLHNKKINQRFLFYYLQSIEVSIKSKVRKAGIPTLDNSVIENLKIPILPKGEQKRIVKILDKFDTLANSISEGLPKEIALRRKQYEYYREQLLSFPEN